MYVQSTIASWFVTADTKESFLLTVLGRKSDFKLWATLFSLWFSQETVNKLKEKKKGEKTSLDTSAMLCKPTGFKLSGGCNKFVATRNLIWSNEVSRLSEWGKQLNVNFDLKKLAGANTRGK